MCNSRPDIKWTKNGEPITAGERHKFVYPDQETAALIISKGIGTYHEISRNLCIKLFHFFSHRRWYWYLQSHFEQRLGRGFHRGKISFVWSSTIQRKNWRSKNWNWCSFQNQGFGKIHESLFLRTYFQNGFSQKLTK